MLMSSMTPALQARAIGRAFIYTPRGDRNSNKKRIYLTEQPCACAHKQLSLVYHKYLLEACVQSGAGCPRSPS